MGALLCLQETAVSLSDVVFVVVTDQTGYNQLVRKTKRPNWILTPVVYTKRSTGTMVAFALAGSAPSFEAAQKHLMQSPAAHLALNHCTFLHGVPGGSAVYEDFEDDYYDWQVNGLADIVCASYVQPKCKVWDLTPAAWRDPASSDMVPDEAHPPVVALAVMAENCSYSCFLIEDDSKLQKRPGLIRGLRDSALLSQQWLQGGALRPCGKYEDEHWPQVHCFLSDS